MFGIFEGWNTDITHEETLSIPERGLAPRHELIFYHRAEIAHIAATVQEKKKI